MDIIIELDKRLLVRPPLEVFSIARILLSDIWLWSQGARARDEEGRRVPPHHPRACCWSLSGAIAVASNPYGVTPPSLLRVLDAVALECGFLRPVQPPLNDTEAELDALLPPTITYDSVDEMNDYCTHDFVLGVLDRTIAIMKASSNEEETRQAARGLATS